MPRGIASSSRRFDRYNHVYSGRNNLGWLDAYDTLHTHLLSQPLARQDTRISIAIVVVYMMIDLKLNLVHFEDFSHPLRVCFKLMEFIFAEDLISKERMENEVRMYSLLLVLSFH